MCGIVGFAKKDSLRDLYEGLRTLEYRGYDSAGVAYATPDKIVICKKKGRVDRLRAFLFSHHADVCMGHTRWATHGAPTALNAHPHRAGRFVVVHNGIISNYATLKRALIAKGRRFLSDTDTEVIAHLLDERMQGDVLQAIREVTEALEGNWAVAALYEGEPDRVYLFKKGNPLIVGKGEDFYCFASDTPALVRYTRTIYKMKDGDIAVITGEDASFLHGESAFEPLYFETTLRPHEVTLGDHTCYMEKEMAEIPKAVEETWRYMGESHVEPISPDVSRVVLTGCGTAYHACLYAAGWGFSPKVCAVVASEFDPKSVGVDEGTVVVAVSQSGETADTLDAAHKAAAAGATVLGVTNVPYSGLTNAVDGCILTKAGAEIAVAATKSYVAQLLALRYLLSSFRPMPSVETLVALTEEVRARLADLDEAASRHVKNVCLLAKGRDYYTALEGALKIKEVACMPCDTCYAGEIKHGPLACVDSHTLVLALSTVGEGERMRTAIHEVRTRGAKVVVVSDESRLCREGDMGFLLPLSPPDWYPALAVQPLQYLAYRLALSRGLDADKPRNLAKSVTVE